MNLNLEMTSSLFSLIGLTIILGCYPSQQHPREQAVPDRSFPVIVEQMKRSIAYLEIRTNIEGVSSKGTAFLIDNSGAIATCYHTLFDTSTYKGNMAIPDTSRIYILFHESKTAYRAFIFAHRKDRDIALLRVMIKSEDLKALSLLPVTFAETSEIREGASIACSGYDLDQVSKPFGNKYYWITTHRGIISCLFAIGPKKGDEFVDHFQVDMLINKGASGAPVYFADDGRVIGMVRSFEGLEKQEITVNYGLANCAPAWAIARLYGDWRRSLKPPDSDKPK